MKNYDFIFSLGASCAASQALRAAGLQFASYPLDWLGTRGLSHVADVIAGGFERFMEFEDMELVDVRHGAGFCTRAYLNRHTNFGFSHEFPDFEPFEESYPKVRKTYERRIRRFFEKADSCRSMLAVYMELPVFPYASKDEMVKARQTLADRFPSAQVDLLYVGLEPGRPVPELHDVAPGVMAAEFDYRKFDRGRITHFVDWAPLVPLLKASFSATDLRSEEEKKKFAAFEKESDDSRWGPDKGAFRRWLNKHVYKTYRTVEQVLMKKGLVQEEGALWFWPVMRDGKEASK